MIRKDGSEIKAQLNYNLATEEMVVDLGHQKMPYPWDDQIVAFVLKDIRFIIFQDQIFELLLEGDVSLLLHGQCKLMRLGQNTGLGRSGTISSRELPPNKTELYELELEGTFEHRDISSFYLLRGDELHLIDKSKQVLELFPDRAIDLKKFMKKEKIRMRKRSDLIHLTTFINQTVIN